MPVRVKVHVDAEKATNEFKAARRDINSRLREGLKVAAEHAALPASRRVAPHFAAPFLIAKATSRSAYITTRGPRWIGRALGLYEYGGTVRTPIVPRNKQALTVGPGIIRARVDTPRRYHPHLRLTRAVEGQRPRIDELVLREVMRAFEGLDHG